MYKPEDLNKAYKTLKKGGVIIYPTDTIWGIGCDATNASAVERIYSIKDRNDRKQMLILVDNIDMIHSYVEYVPNITRTFIESADKPLSIIFPNAMNLPVSLVGEENTIGIRVVREDFCRALIEKLGKPIVSTSANMSGDPYPARFEQILEKIKESADYIVKWRQDENKHAAPSEIIKFSEKGEIIKIR